MSPIVGLPSSPSSPGHFPLLSRKVERSHRHGHSRTPYSPLPPVMKQYPMSLCASICAHFEPSFIFSCVHVMNGRFARYYHHHRVSKRSPFVGPRPLRNIEEYFTLTPIWGHELSTVCECHLEFYSVQAELLEASDETDGKGSRHLYMWSHNNRAIMTVS